MRLSQGAAASALATLALGWWAGPAQALSGVPGGTTAPASPKVGGIEYGFPARVVQHPVITLLSVPSAARAGAPPRVVLRLDEKGVGTVYVRVSVTDLASHRAAVVANMGWSHTGRTLTVRWPSGARLAPGTYEVSVSARDHHGSSLLRRAHSSGRAMLTVTAPKPPASVAPAPTPAPTPAPAPELGVPTPAETKADGATFPVVGTYNFGGPENRFGAPRTGHVHEGQDVMAAEGTPVVAPMAGTIESTSFQAGGAGYYAVEHTAVGLDFMFAHCQEGSFGVTAGQAVAVGAALCRVGQTGDATAPHLHFEIWVGGWQAPTGHPIDPLPYLEAWAAG